MTLRYLAEARKTDRTVQVKGLALLIHDCSADGIPFRWKTITEKSSVSGCQVFQTICLQAKYCCYREILVPIFAAAQVLVKCPSKYETEKHPTKSENKGCFLPV